MKQPTLHFHNRRCGPECSGFCQCPWQKRPASPADVRSCRLVLGSGSSYRADLLKRLNVAFVSLAPEVNESSIAHEPPDALAVRLAADKASAAARLLTSTDLLPRDPVPDALIIGSDQVASTMGERLRKPGSVERAQAQLTRMQGQSVTFHTALCLLSTATGESFTALDTTVAAVRKLEPDEIQRYIRKDNPLDCAGSFKVEALGISLFDRITCEDPTAVIGLPLIELCKGLRHFGLALP